MIEVNLNRKNTYTNDEYFKVVVLTKDESTSIEQSKWITNNYKKLIRNDIMRCEYKSTSLVCYPRCNGIINNAETKAFEALYVFVEDKESFDNVTPVISQYYFDLKARILVSNNPDAAEWAKSVNAVYLNAPTRQKVVELLDHLDMNNYEEIENKFNQFDADKNGYITTDEMPKIAHYFGEESNSESLKAAILAFDKNQDGKINIQEFISWYKLGRKDTLAFTKFFDLNNYITDYISKVFKVPKLELQMSNDEINRSAKVNKIDVTLDTKNIEEYITRLYFKVAIGESARKEACKNYLSRYNDKMEFNSDYFIDIAVFTKSCTINGLSAKEYIENFKDQLIEKIDNSFIPGFKAFISNFLVVRIFDSDYSVNLRLEFKYDIQELFKSSISSFLKITNWLTNNNKVPLDLDVKYLSGKCIGDIFEEGGLLKDFIENCEFKVKFSALKERNLALANSTQDNIKSYIDFFQPFFVPSNLKLKYEGKIDELMDSHSKEILNKKVDFIKDFIDFLKAHIPEDLRRVMSRLEIGVNLIDSFFSTQLFSEHLWH